MKTNTFKKISAAVLSLSLIGGTVPADLAGISLFDTSISVSAEEAVVSFSKKTGTLTIKSGEINPDDIRYFAGDSRVKHVIAEKGAVMPENCRDLFSLYLAEDIDLSKADASKMKLMEDMFYDCARLKTLDISSFWAGSESMDLMFACCPKLTTIYVSDKWMGVANTYHTCWTWDGLFEGCYKLKGENGTAYSKYGDKQSYACIDTAEHPGYFTQKVPEVSVKKKQLDKKKKTLKAQNSEE